MSLMLSAEGTFIKYAVTAINGNAESEQSAWIDTDPDSWLNFDQMPGEPFRRMNWNSPDYSHEIENLYYVE